MGSNPEVVVREDPSELAVEASDFILREIQDASAAPFSLALAGGSTMAQTYRELSGLPVDWSGVHLFLSDDRYVPYDSEHSNSGMVRESLVEVIDIDGDHVHLMSTELPPDEAARSYEEQIRQLVPGEPLPTFDLLLLGIGSNGHTASLFPGEPEVQERQRLVVATRNELVTPPGPPLRRLTFTFPLINAARVVAVVASGEDKALAVGAAVRRENPEQITASNIAPTGRLVWLLDRAAAARL